MRILMICTAFAPENEIGCIRTTKLVKYLVRDGHDVTVISPTIHEGMRISNDLLCSEIDQIRHIHVPYSVIFQSLLLKKRNRMTQSGAKVKIRTIQHGFKHFVFSNVEELYTQIRNIDWYNQVKKKIKHCKLVGFDFVFSSYPSISAHWSARYARNKGIATEWIADFRDPMVYEMSSTYTQKKNRKKQNKLVNEADYVTVVSNDVIYKFSTGQNNSKKIHVIPNGIDFEDYQTNSSLDSISSNDNRLSFCYAGGLYGGKRDLTPFFGTLRKLIDSKEIDEKGIIIHYCGRDYQVFLVQASQFGIESMIQDHGMIDHTEAVRLEMMCDCNIVCTHNSHSDRGVVPGKLYECLAANKFVLGIVNGNEAGSELSRLVSTFHAGESYEEANHDSDIVKLEQTIMSLYREKMKNGKVAIQIDDRIKTDYSYEKLSRKLVELVQ